MSFRPDAKIFDDLAKVAGGAVNMFSGVRQQIEGEIKARIDDMADRLDLVPREDFDRLNALVTKLSARLDVLEGKNMKKTSSQPTKPKTTSRKKGKAKK